VILQHSSDCASPLKSISMHHKGWSVSDIVSKAKRSSMMAAVRQKHTKPEKVLRRALHSAGGRFRLHRRDLPGTPDLVFPTAQVAVFVNGCFWHRHQGCRKASTPATRAEFWQDKFDKNVARDRRAHLALRAAGWKVYIVWECEVPTPTAATKLAKRLVVSVKKRARVDRIKVLNEAQSGDRNARR
jgi:DNA mismatch endonuclease (patch repair protein)